MRFVESWAELQPYELARWLLPIAALLLVVIIPGRRVARIGAIAVAASLVTAPGYAGPPALARGWALLWVAIAIWACRPGPRPRRPWKPFGLIESGSVGLLAGVTLLALLVAAVARQGVPAEIGRRAAAGILMIGLGLLHLSVRRHVRRSAIGFASLGLGLQTVTGAAEAVVLSATPPYGSGILAATAIAAGLAIRIGGIRERVATSPWVADAHDLHD